MIQVHDLIQVPSLGTFIYEVVLVYPVLGSRTEFKYLIDMSDDYRGAEFFSYMFQEYMLKQIKTDMDLNYLVGRPVLWVRNRDYPIVVGHI